MTDSNSLAPKSTEVQNATSSQIDYIVVDGSSSMKDKWWEFMAALDIYISGLKAANVNSRGICSVFCTQDVAMIQRDAPLHDWPTMSDQPLEAYWSMTPLFDAINAMGRHMRDLNPERASIVIVTDGDENASSYTTVDQARSILDWCKAKGWAVTFIGCDFNNSAQARALGITDANSVGVAKALLSDAAAELARKRAAHAHGKDDMNFSDAEKKQFGGYLAAPQPNDRR